MGVITARTGWIALLVAATLAAGAGPASAQTTLRYQFKQGEKLPYVMGQKMAMTMDIGGNPVMMSIEQTINLTWKITALKKDGTAEMVQKIDRVRFHMTTPMGGVEYDSQNGKIPEGPIGQAVGPIFQALNGAEITLTMSPQGKTSDVKVPQKVLDAVKNVPGGAALGEMFSEEGFKRLVGQGGTQLPAGAVTKGQSWDQKTEFKMPFGKMKMDTKCTYKGPAVRDGKTLETIALEPKMSLEADPNAPVAMTLKDQSAKGTVYFDNMAGRLVEMSLKQNMTMEVSAGGQMFTQKVETTVNFKLADAAK